MRKHDLNALNNGALTQVTYQVGTAVALTICLPALEWSGYCLRGQSDCYPIIVTVMDNTEAEKAIEKYNLKKTE